jgi:hypothetical protein
LVQLISGLDRAGRNVTTDNFFTSVDLANQLKNKILSLVGKMKQNKREIPPESKSAKQRDENSSILYLPRISLLCRMSQRRTNQLSSFHHSIVIQQSAAIQKNLKLLNFITEQKLKWTFWIKFVQGTGRNWQMDNGNILWLDQIFWGICIGNIRTQHAQI